MILTEKKWNQVGLKPTSFTIWMSTLSSRSLGPIVPFNVLDIQELTAVPMCPIQSLTGMILTEGNILV